MCSVLMLCCILAFALHIVIIILENRPIMLAYCLILLPAYYARNYAGIIGASLLAMPLNMVTLMTKSIKRYIQCLDIAT